MIAAVHQPQYMPWLGYFDKIDRADVFVLLDTVQFKKNEWQNRNRIRTAEGWQWLTVPVRYRFPQRICEVEINDTVRWQHKQWQALRTLYARARHRDYLDGLLEEVFSRSWQRIAPLNIAVVRGLARTLGIETPILVASELPGFPEDPDERLIAITRHVGADVYLAGSGGRGYMDLERYERAGVEVGFQAYEHPVYDQCFEGFEPYLSVLDLLLNHGPESLSILRGSP